MLQATVCPDNDNTELAPTQTEAGAADAVPPVGVPEQGGPTV